ncbi:hypothetical protein GCM10009696_11640 [Kocuria himachalensis]
MPVHSRALSSRARLARQARADTHQLRGDQATVPGFRATGMSGAGAFRLTRCSGMAAKGPDEAPGADVEEVPAAAQRASGLRRR